MKSYYDNEAVDRMREAIIEKYGPTIHGAFIKDMSIDRVSRIYVNMKLLEERSYRRNDCIKGQMSLFD